MAEVPLSAQEQDVKTSNCYSSRVKEFLIGEAESLPDVLCSVAPETAGSVLSQLEAVLQSSGCLHAEDVRGAWSSYLELLVEPAGWRALLRPSPNTSALLGLHQSGDRRAAILVNVLDVLSDSLEAEVELVRNSQDGEVVGGLLTVPIDELYAVKQQEIPTLDLTSTVTAIELIRFFYENIWMPWDEESEEEDWPGQHLENRVRLHFNLMSGCGDQATAMRLDELAARAELNRTELQELENTARTEDGTCEETEMSYEVIGRLYELHQEQDSIRREAEMLENPKLRAALSSKAASARKKARNNLSRDAGILLVWSSGDLASLGSVLARVTEEFGGGAKVMVHSELQHALDSSLAGDVVIVASGGEHQLSSLGSLSSGGALLARTDRPGSVIITPGDTSAFVLSLTAGTLKLEDVLLESGSVRVSVLVSSAALILSNVTIRGGQTAVLAEQGASVKVTNCNFSDSETAVEVGHGAQAEMEGSVIENNKTGVCLRGHAAVSVSSCVVRNNRNCGIMIHSDHTEGLWTGEQAVERARQLRVKIKDTEFTNNRMADVGALEVKENIGTPIMERRSNIARRFSTPLSGKSQKDMETSGATHSPIPSSLSRVLSFPI